MADLSTQLMDAAEIMLIGMTTVFVFLSSLVWLVGLMGRIVQKYTPTPSTTEPASKKTTLRPEVVAAITTAVHRYRASHAPAHNEKN